MSERAIFLAALDKDQAERDSFLEEACAGNESLRRGLDTLLRLHAAPHHFLEVPAIVQLTASASGPDSSLADLSFLSPCSKASSLGRLDHYEILAVIGRGAMGIVFRARDTKLERVVAIKMLAPVSAISPSARQRFVREARAAAAISQDNVITIHAVEDASLPPYLVMQFIDGPTLQAKLERSRPLPSNEVVRIGFQIAEGLAAAHRQGLIHRDIKPANILLENGIERVKITDLWSSPCDLGLTIRNKKPPLTVGYITTMVKGGANAWQRIAEGNSPPTVRLRAGHRKPVFGLPTAAVYPRHDPGLAHRGPRASE